MADEGGRARRPGRCVGVLLLVCGCGPGGGGGALDAASAPSCWRELPGAPALDLAAPAFEVIGERALDAMGRSDVLDVPIPPGTGVVVLRALAAAPGPRCFQLDSVTDDAGNPWVTPPAIGADWGPYCVSCPQRVAVGAGYGLFVLPSNDHPPAAAAGLRVRVAARDCDTLLAHRPAGAGERVRLEALRLPAPASDRAGLVPLEIAITAGSFLHDGAADLDGALDEILREVNRLLAPGRLQAAITRVRLTDDAGDVAMTRGDLAPLDALNRTIDRCDGVAPSGEQARIRVVLAGCIEITEPFTGTSTSADGYTVRIPDGLPADGHAAGTFIAGRACIPGVRPAPIASSVLAALLAHELGHALGLYHSLEADGTADQIADTDGTDLMRRDPLAGAAGFTAGQLSVMRRHPLIRWR